MNREKEKSRMYNDGRRAPMFLFFFSFLCLVVQVNQYVVCMVVFKQQTIRDVMEMFASGGRRKDGTVASSGHQCFRPRHASSPVPEFEVGLVGEQKECIFPFFPFTGLCGSRCGGCHASEVTMWWIICAKHNPIYGPPRICFALILTIEGPEVHCWS